MLPLGMLLVLGGYGIGSWGYLLVKGFNITLREWFSPLNPYSGPLGANGMVPPGSIFPTGKAGSPSGGGTAPPPKAKPPAVGPNPHGTVQ